MEDKQEKIYTPSEELRDIMIQYQAEIILRDRYIQLRYLGHKAASKAAFEAERCRNNFWRGIFAEFPELRDKPLSYNIQENRLTAMDPKHEIEKIEKWDCHGF